MRIIKPSFELWQQEEGIEGLYKHIEKCGRICYASEVIEGKAKDFIDRMITLGHGSVLEHGTVYLKCNTMEYESHLLHKYYDNKYSKCVAERKDLGTNLHITTNYRVLLQGSYETYEEARNSSFDKNWLEDLKFICEPTEHHIKRYTVKFTTQIGITRDFNRHRVNSISEQSTRYCDYTKDKFGGVGINLPSWISGEEVDDKLEHRNLQQYCEIIANKEENMPYSTLTALDYWIFANLTSSYCYNNLRRLGWSPQKAKTILPLDTNSELVHTAFSTDWEHFFNIRALGSTGKAHPDAELLAQEIMNEFTKLGYI